MINMFKENKYLIFFQKILLSKANKESIPTKYPKNSNIIPKKSIENSNQENQNNVKIEGNTVYLLKI